METSPETVSPVPTKLDFPDAIREIMNGKKVRREEWPAGEYAVLERGFLVLYNPEIHTWKVSQGDFEGKDWITL